MTPDAVVVGAGIIGLAIARKLARAGARVVVVDRDEPGMQASWAAAGMLAPLAEADAPGPFLDLLLRANTLYPSVVREVEEETGVGVGYRTEGMIVLAFDDEEESELAGRYEWQSAAGLPVERLTAKEALQAEPGVSPNILSGLRFPGDHQVDNRLLTRAYHVSAAAAGAVFSVGAAVTAVRRSAGGLAVEIQGGDEIETAIVVLAAGAWSGLIPGLPGVVPVEPVHGQLMAIEMGSPPLRHLIASGSGYMVPRSDGRLIVGATADRVGFRQPVTVSGLHRLSTMAMRMAPATANRPLIAHWAGFRPGTPDGLPILGSDPEMPGLIYATGHYRNGILLAPITAEIVVALAQGGQSPLDLAPYRRDRFGGA